MLWRWTARRRATGGGIAIACDGRHLSSWYLERRADTRQPLGGASAQWELEASLSERPTGGVAPRGTRAYTHFGVYEVGPEDELSTLSIRRRK